MSYYRDEFDDYDILYSNQDGEEVYCSSCGEGIFYRLDNWCICTECGRKIHIDDFQAYVNHEFF